MNTQALYVDLDRGPYVDLLGAANCWGVERDAKTYAGPGPVVAHPPCGPWGSLRKFCTKQDPECGPRAVEQVRAFGGVLEHPQGSLLWRRCGLPRPFRSVPTFAPREWSLSVQQVDWGHPTVKPTWLLFVGVDPRSLPPMPPPGTPTHCLSGSAKPGDRGYTGRPVLWSRDAHLTPPAFARWLVDAASSAKGYRLSPSKYG